MNFGLRLDRADGVARNLRLRMLQFAMEKAHQYRSSIVEVGALGSSTSLVRGCEFDLTRSY